MKESILTTDEQVREILKKDDDITNFEVSTRAEVHYTGKENIEGFASLVNMFLRSMLMTSKSPCLINVDNIDSKVKDLEVQDGQIFYQATVQFKDTFTNLLNKKIKELKTINVHVSFQDMPDNEFSIKAANRIGSKTFAYIGLKQTIKV